MRRRPERFNSKRRIRNDVEPAELQVLLTSVVYCGNPEHKRNPGDFGLTPPSLPRPDKTLCDMLEIFSRDEATRLLKAGIERGLVSERREGDFPQNVWAVTADGRPVEAQLENSATGAYHGYPMPSSDPFHDVVIAHWNRP